VAPPGESSRLEVDHVENIYITPPTIADAPVGGATESTMIGDIEILGTSSDSRAG